MTERAPESGRPLTVATDRQVLWATLEVEWSLPDEELRRLSISCSQSDLDMLAGMVDVVLARRGLRRRASDDKESS